MSSDVQGLIVCICAVATLLLAVIVHLIRMGKRAGRQESMTMDHDKRLGLVEKRLNYKVSGKELENMDNNLNQRLDDINQTMQTVLKILMQK